MAERGYRGGEPAGEMKPPKNTGSAAACATQRKADANDHVALAIAVGKPTQAKYPELLEEAIRQRGIARRVESAAFLTEDQRRWLLSGQT